MAESLDAVGEESRYYAKDIYFPLVHGYDIAFTWPGQVKKWFCVISKLPRNRILCTKEDELAITSMQFISRVEGES